MSRWLISVPVWGERYVSTFEQVAVPSLLAAVDVLGEPVKFVIHTDAPARVRAALAGHEVEVRPVDPKPTYVALQQAHSDALLSAEAGDRVVLLNADLAISGNLLARCAEHFSSGKQAVVVLGIRTAGRAERPPAGASPRALLEWAWLHRHQIIRDLEWPLGTSYLPTNLFFARGASVVARGFHLHPVAVVRHDAIAFKSTIDGDLLDFFPREDIHVVVDPDDCSMCEVSPPERRFPVRDGAHLNPLRVATSMRTRASPMHRWLVTHRIGVIGDLCDCGDEEVIAEILKFLGQEGPAAEIRQRGAQPAEALPRRLRGVLPAGPRGHPR